MIKRIFVTDIKNLFRSFFALVIIIGVCFLPALYAWLNIYSNWDPYARTGNLKIAVVSMDQGYTDKDGKKINAGESITEGLRENKAIDSHTLSSKKKAVEGVRSGKYYAALIVPKDFTDRMYHVFTENVERPTLYFYQNQKKNAVAGKITDTVAGNLQEKLNDSYIRIISEKFFEETNDVSVKLDSKDSVNKILASLKDMRSDIRDYKKMIRAVKKGNGILRDALVAAGKDTKNLSKAAKGSSRDISRAEDEIDKSQDVVNDYAVLVSSAMKDVNRTLSNMKKNLKAAQVTSDVKEIESHAKKTSTDVDRLRRDLEALKDATVTDVTGVDAVALRSSYSSMSVSMKSLNRLLLAIQKSEGGSAALDKKRQAALAKVEDALLKVDDIQKQFDHKFIPQLNDSIDSVEDVLADSSEVMQKMSDTLSGMGNVFRALKSTVGSADKSMDKTLEALDLIDTRLAGLIHRVDQAKEDERGKVLLDTLSGNPKNLGEFFADPVKVKTTIEYPVKNYGSAVTPFYTILAIWVGALILTAVMGTHPTASKYPGARGYQLFFGRFLIFALLGQIQAAIIVWGDLVLLKVQCASAFFFWLAAAVASFTFTILIFALVASFGDVGKALAVVLVVLQIAGSSGTYPIELLPQFFRKVYIFFPFPYAINALRECVAGMNGREYWILLLQLSSFILVALAIGIWIRKPFAELNHYMEKRMKDTEMM